MRKREGAIRTASLPPSPVAVAGEGRGRRRRRRREHPMRGREMAVEIEGKEEDSRIYGKEGGRAVFGLVNKGVSLMVCSPTCHSVLFLI